ncbi:Hsp33 family molecular chaperone HslO [Candidatus Methylopumilus universalis]|uniref:Hsp33 family molecular chaperone HslO n=1 Tax=Candidatus Methylopumilus universalis TaxID=2588536 RepID=UPI00111F0222|nr:Hsp33 family molecular chaperone HslO [Candidatus Methylopumilus universalis]QDC70525.1 Hsp33 family molecular chaperone HslO [Candidatus Methylopumilus universalis]
MHNSEDKLYRFIFEDTDIRGNYVKLSHTIEEATQHQALPKNLHTALGELMVASALLASTLKLDGSLTLQIQTNGPLKLLIAECNGNLGMRGTVKWSGPIESLSPIDLIKEGHFIITLVQKNAKTPYQGIVPMEGNSISELLENYMLRSEQIQTKLWIHSQNDIFYGLLIQKLPFNSSTQELNQDEMSGVWESVVKSANQSFNSLGPEVEASEILQNVFLTETIRLYDPSYPSFYCSCSKKSVENMLRLIGKKECESIIEEQASITIHCDFCNECYKYSEDEVVFVFNESNNSVKH